MKKKMTINYIFNLAYQILIIILPLITTPYVSRILGPDGIGAYSYTASITTYFILFGCIGLNLYGQREVAYHQSDKIAISKTFFEILLLKIGTMAISICVFIFTVQMMNQYKLLFYIQLLDLIANMLDITYFYQGIEEFKVIVIRNVLIKIIGIICIFTFVKTKADLDRLGIKTFFCSNVCAMYRRSIYEKLGGFVKHTIFNEDMIFAGKLIQEGYAIAYVAEARVVHSHNYTNRQQLHRNFDLAVSQADHPEIFAMAKSESEGIRMVKATAAYLISQRKPYLIPVLGMRSASKLLGYRLGRSYQKLPENIVLHLTGNKSYWEKKKKLQSRCKN